MKTVFVVHTKIAIAGSYDTFEVKLFADKAAAEKFEAEEIDRLNEEYAADLEDDPNCVEVYTIELPIN